MERSPLEGCLILVVEDEPLIAMDIELAFDECGAQIALANTVEDAMILVEQKDFAIGILDHGLTDGESTGVYERMRDRGIPFIIYTGHDIPDDKRGGGLVLTKPASEQDLRKAAEDLVTARQNPAS
jgi:DNA-binding response OmpR family regulator